MLTIAQDIYPQEYEQLKSIVEAIQRHDMPEAKHLLAVAKQNLAAIVLPAQRLQKELFIKALQGRLDHSQAENLYLVPDEGQQIRMFNFMAEKFPVVRSTQSIANAIFLSEISDKATSFLILD